eukprot:g9041.t1
MSKYNNNNSSGNGGGGGGGSHKENGGSKDGLFDLDSAAFSSDQFRMHEFKVKRCPRARPHDWTQCPFAHPGEKARRRDPRRYKYSGTACPEFRKSGCCRRGDACPFAHGVFECWLHPSRYRTQLCTDGTACRRRVCFFAHLESELRHPEDDPGIAQKQVQAELAAEVQTLQQQHLTQALQALLLQTTNPLQVPDRQINQGNGLTADLIKQNPTNAVSNGTAAGNHTLPNSVDQGNPTTALQLALLQQLQQNAVDKTAAAAAGSSQTQTASEALPQTTTGSQATPSVYNALTQLQQLMSETSTTAPPVVASTPQSNDAMSSTVNAAAILSQMMTGNGFTTPPTSMAELPNNALLMNNFLNQNAAKMAMVHANGNANGGGGGGGMTRRSIDNSYFNSLGSDSNAAMAAAAAAATQFGSAGFPTVLHQNGTLLPNANPMTTATTTKTGQDINIPVVVPNSVPSPSIPVNSMYSMENIQLLLQNPAFSSNLSQLLQMNPGLLQQLTHNANDSGNHTRHSIDNAYLSQLTTDINRFVNNGGVKSGSETQVMGNGMTHCPQQEAFMMTSDLFAQQQQQQQTNDASQRAMNGLTVSEALIQGLNALKMQIEGTAPLSAPMTIQATIPVESIQNCHSTTSQFSIPSSNHSSSDNALQTASESSGDGGNYDPGANSSMSEPQIESSE